MTGEYTDLIRNTSVMKSITAAVREKTLSHAYLVVSEDTDAVDLLFDNIAYTVFCQSGGCGECAECARIKSGNHADVHYLRPQDGKKLVSVQDVERLVEDCYNASFTGGYKLYFVPNAEKMPEPVQNKLLKTLEEPPKNVVFFLGIGNERVLLNTIRSRTKKLYLPAFSAEELAEALGGSVKARLAAAYSGGSLTRALRMMQNDHYSALTDDVLNVLCALKKSSDVGMFCKHNVFVKDNLSDTLTVLETIFSDLLSIAIGRVDKLNFFDKKEILEGLSNDYSAEAVSAIIPHFTEARRKLSLNCNSQAVVDNLLYTILEVRHKCRRL